MQIDPVHPSEDAARTTRHTSGSSSPERIGAYRIVALIGEGAMGVVYEAQQDRPQRHVALKLMKPGLATPAMLRRFEHEYEFLGRLQHVGIAQIYEAGVADTGYGPQPYFAMELVRGRRLDQYVRAAQPGVRDRLLLVAQIADAVQHAHHRGVIHRDLKPPNILVTETGIPKVLDFGLARAADVALQSTVQTMAGEVVGTMSYMSPEQVLGNVAELDTRSDVYALGVILYEVLAGQLPFDLRGKSLPEAVRAIRDDEPVRLSSVARGLPGDVSTIVAKALEKDKLRRYSSAAEFAEDIRRFLRHEPIVARPPSATYQVRKFARRHKALVGAVAAVFLALLVGVAVSSWQAIRASRAERVAQARASEAQAERAKAEAVTKFLTEMLSSVDPAQARGREITVRAALDAAAAKIDAGAMKGQPEVEVSVRHAIATTYEGLGLLAAAERQLRTALDLQPGPGANAALLGETNARLASVLYHAGNHAGMLPVAREALRLRRESLGARHADVAASTDDLGVALLMNGDGPGAVVLFREALTIRRQILPAGDPQLSVSLNNLAFTVKEEGNLEEAETLFREALAIDRRTLGNEHPELAKKLVNVVLVLLDQGKPDAAEPFAREAVAIRRKVLGNDHPALANALDVLAAGLLDQGRRGEAEPLAREARAIALRTFGETHADTARLSNNLGWVLYEEGAYAEAESLFRAAAAGLRKTLGGKHQTTGLALSGLAYTLQGLGDVRGAESAAREALAVYRQRPADKSVVGTLGALGGALLAQRRSEEALPVLREARDILEAHAPLRKRWFKPYIQGALGAALATTGEVSESERLLIAGYEGLRDLRSTPRAHLREAVQRLVAFYTTSGRPAEAVAWRKRLAALEPAGQ